MKKIAGLDYGRYGDKRITANFHFGAFPIIGQTVVYYRSVTIADTEIQLLSDFRLFIKRIQDGVDAQSWQKLNASRLVL